MKSNKSKPETCELCGCEPPYNFHHCIPRTLHSNKWFKKNFTREQMQEGLEVCRQCHRTLHEMIPEKGLGRDFNTREKLLAHPDFGKYVQWKRKRAGIRKSGEMP
ncbi:MAG: hypothetical protein CMJ78_26255 [Planctomycetaceae bacterium]|nr:hypothetical protein [Planctomycetaceae bacterium]